MLQSKLFMFLDGLDESKLGLAFLGMTRRRTVSGSMIETDRRFANKRRHAAQRIQQFAHLLIALTLDVRWATPAGKDPYAFCLLCT